MRVDADVVYFADTKWWEWHHDRDEFRRHRGERCTIESTGLLIDDPDTHMLRNAGQRLMSLAPDALHTGYNSGYQAVNIAVLAGATTIVLVGYDAKPGPDGRKHFFGDHPDKTSAPYAHMLIAFKEVAPWLEDKGVKVLNASPDSALTMFEQVRLQDVFT